MYVFSSSQKKKKVCFQIVSNSIAFKSYIVCLFYGISTFVGY